MSNNSIPAVSSTAPALSSQQGNTSTAKVSPSIFFDEKSKLLHIKDKTVSINDEDSILKIAEGLTQDEVYNLTSIVTKFKFEKSTEVSKNSSEKRPVAATGTTAGSPEPKKAEKPMFATIKPGQNLSKVFAENYGATDSKDIFDGTNKIISVKGNEYISEKGADKLKVNDKVVLPPKVEINNKVYYLKNSDQLTPVPNELIEAENTPPKIPTTDAKTGQQQPTTNPKSNNFGELTIKPKDSEAAEKFDNWQKKLAELRKKHTSTTDTTTAPKDTSKQEPTINSNDLKKVIQEEIKEEFKKSMKGFFPNNK